jgi:chorismate mutase
MSTQKNASEFLAPYRARLDALDADIVALLCQRFDIIREVAAVKIAHNVPVVIEERIREVINRAGDKAGDKDRDRVREIYTMLVALACELEEEMIDHQKHKEK